MLTLVATSSFEVGPAILLAGPIVGGLMYWLIFQFYRNTNKSHKYEHETLIESQPPTGNDLKIRSIHKTTNATTSQANGTEHRRRVQRLS